MKNGLWHYPHVPKFAPRSEWVCKLAMSAPALCICSAFCQRQVSHNWWLELLILAIWKKVSLLQESNKKSSLIQIKEDFFVFYLQAQWIFANIYLFGGPRNATQPRSWRTAIAMASIFYSVKFLECINQTRVTKKIRCNL